MQHCINCGHELDDNALYCPICGVKINKRSRKFSGFDVCSIIGLAFTIEIIGLAIFLFSPTMSVIMGILIVPLFSIPIVLGAIGLKGKCLLPMAIIDLSISSLVLLAWLYQFISIVLY